MFLSMHVTLMHNPKAGTEALSRKELLREFQRAGHKVAYHSVKEDGIGHALKNPGDVVVVAGGDGTVRKIGTQLRGREVPIAILPLGTANNIARALGLHGNHEELIRALAGSRVVKLDVGVARGPWGEMPFLEGAGAGLFPRMLSDHASNRRQGVPDAVDALGGIRGGLHFLQQVLHTFRGPNCVVRLDGKELRGSFLLIEALNIPAIGPTIQLAPRAHPDDGLLDVVTISDNQRRKLDAHLDAKLAHKAPARFATHRTRKLELSCAPTEFHFDDKCWPTPSKRKSVPAKPANCDLEVEITVEPGALNVLVP
jgi:diacylglycerol kinase (ATP)